MGRYTSCFLIFAHMIGIYTDGSCHTQRRVGAWVAILLMGTEKKLLSGSARDTTHHRMELTAVIEAIKYIGLTGWGLIDEGGTGKAPSLRICSDSQYVTGIPARADKLKAKGFSNKKGEELQNADLMKELLRCCEPYHIEWIEIRSHQKMSPLTKYNIEADILSRQMVRQMVDQPV